MEIRTVSSHLSSDGNKLAGYAAVYNSPSQVLSERGRSFTETIAPTAFQRSLNEGRDVTAHYSHNEDTRPPLGRVSAGTLHLQSDERGLAFQLDLPTWAADIREAVQRGDIRGMSFKFKTMKDSWQQRDGQHHRTLHDVDLYHVALVNDPAYPQTSVAVRSHVEPPETFSKQHHRTLHDVYLEHALVKHETFSKRHHRTLHDVYLEHALVKHETFSKRHHAELELMQRKI